MEGRINLNWGGLAPSAWGGAHLPGRPPGRVRRHRRRRTARGAGPRIRPGRFMHEPKSPEESVEGRRWGGGSRHAGRMIERDATGGPLERLIFTVTRGRSGTGFLHRLVKIGVRGVTAANGPRYPRSAPVDPG